MGGTKHDAMLTGTETEYAQRRKQHLALINQLRAIGAQAELDLPRVAVIGNQSAGKSSLVEAISGINVPRDAGTCTRCPMECRLASSAEPWSCQVLIRWEFDADGRPREKVVEERFCAPLADKSHVELVLRRAQAAVLNPKTDARKFWGMPAAAIKDVKNELDFSRNAVCMDIAGPELTDLAFVDLPGIIQNASTETVQLVEDLVRANIKGNCLILVTLPMSDDIENQKAMQLAKQVDPTGQRTIGVMTKPDTLPPGATKSRDLWLDVIEGRRFPLKHGYYCTRQPDDDERTKGITTAQAREAEMAFFRNNAPWSTSAQKHRFGTTQLVANLSKLLTQIIYDTMPKLRTEAAHQLTATLQRLKALPAAVTTEPTSHVLRLVTSFCRDVALHVDGDPNAAGLVQMNRRSYGAFKRDIRASAPMFLPMPSQPAARTDLSKFVSPDDEGEPAEDKNEVVDLTGSSDDQSSTPRWITLQDVRKHIEKSLGKELPGNVPYGAKVSMIRDFQASWELDSRKCFDDVFRAFNNALSRLVQDRFDRYESLRFHVSQTLKALLDAQKDVAWERVQDILSREKSPYTQNTHYLQVSKEKFLSLYRSARVAQSTDALPDQPAMKRRKTEDGSKGVPTKVATPAPATAPGTPASPLAPAQTQTVFGQPAPTQSAFGQRAFAALASATGTQALSAPQTPVQPPQQQPKPFWQLPTPQPSLDTHAAQGQKRARSSLDDEQRAQYEQQAVLALTALGYKVDVPDFPKLLPPDVYEDELQVMAEIRAYFRVAYKRVIDDVPMAIDDQFLAAFSRRLQDFLLEKLGIGGPNAAARCAAYLAEDPLVVAERDELTAKKQRLESVQAELLHFGLAS